MAIFFFDIDGTLAYNGEIVGQNITTLQTLREKGHMVCICSGRPISYIEQMFANYCDAIIASNGRYINYQGTCIYKNPIDNQSMWKYHKIAQEAGGMCHFAGLEKRYVYELDKAYISQLNKHLSTKLVQIAKDDKVDVYSFEVNYLPPFSFEDMRKAYGDEVILNNHFDNFSADASTASFDKGSGIEKLLELLGLDKKDAYAFGDGSNDLCMFRACAHSIAMGNAIEPLKQCAQFVTTHFQEEGIQVALQHYNIL